MTWNQNLAEANWIQLGYSAANVASLLVPLSKKAKIDVSDADKELLRQQAEFFDAAMTGWTSFDQPALLFQRPAHSIAFPSSALETAAEIYSSVHGGPLLDPKKFKSELSAFAGLLKRLAEGGRPEAADAPIIKDLEVFLGALIDKARGELHKSTRLPR